MKFPRTIKFKIHYTVGECILGSLLVASSEKGVCSILLGDDPEALVPELRRRYPIAELVEDSSDPTEALAHVVALVENPNFRVPFSLDPGGTPFQQKVWQALADIPIGETITYAQLARQIQMPKAVRAVAGACGANSLAVVIPCHRVIRTDGSLSGYRWGVERKRALLRIEQEMAVAAPLLAVA